MPTRAITLGAALTLLAIMAAVPALADEAPGQTPQREANIVETDLHPWSAVGKLNNGLFGACTAVLISDDYALTTAHCLYFKILRRFLPPESFRLVLGYDNQRPSKGLHVVAYYIPPAYNPRKPIESTANDWALLQIANDPKSGVTPVSLAREIDLTKQIEVMTAGYSSRRQHKMSAVKDCRIIGRSTDDKILYDTCNIPDAFSGGPVLALNPDGRSFSVLGINVARQDWQGISVAIAVSAAAIWPQIRSCIEEHKCSFQHVAVQRDPTAAEIFAGLPSFGLRKVIDVVADRFCRPGNPQCSKPSTGANGLDGQVISPESGQRDPVPAAGP